ncbi:aldo/keto reductase [Aquimarina sp. 2201CG5-10]|uniref:aldo/keto reductase n=1 Tax=Aquimarina callyspongiae TaxID=3098150 RepID=UPI002AB3B56F|nr:aldo/keto reductase [Aquimarina sp. 2201CG5-10]MDY8138672.1 aldo/keto reductase [Aquimarina sp. 2201CG5-10]
MINKLVLGTVQLGLNYGINNLQGRPSLDSSFNILRTAYNNGITIIDTAEAYGISQEVIGKFQQKNPSIQFEIITKLAANCIVPKGELLDHISNNCKILSANRLHGYMFHNYDNFKKNINLYDEILSARKDGIIEKAGISLYTNNEIEDIISNYDGFDFIQIPFNLLDNQYKRKTLLEKAKNKGIEIHTRSVFLQGLFFKKTEDLSDYLKPLTPYLKLLNNIKEKSSVSIEALALQYALQKEYVDHVLIGVESEEQLINNIKICKEKLSIPNDEIDLINVKEEEMLNPSNWT